MQNSGIFRLYQYLFLFVCFKLSMYVWGCVHKGTESEQVRREHWMPWNWSYRRLRAAMWVEERSSEGEACIFNC